MMSKTKIYYVPGGKRHVLERLSDSSNRSLKVKTQMFDTHGINSRVEQTELWATNLPDLKSLIREIAQEVGRLNDQPPLEVQGITYELWGFQKSVLEHYNHHLIKARFRTLESAERAAGKREESLESGCEIYRRDEEGNLHCPYGGQEIDIDSYPSY